MISTQDFQGIFHRFKHEHDDIKCDPVLHGVSGQEPSMSSKSPIHDPPFSHTSNRDIKTELAGSLLRVKQDNL